MIDRQIAERELEIILTKLDESLEVPGDVVEFGCYRGDTSVLLSERLDSASDRWLWLYDSFEGLPEKSLKDNSPRGWRFKKGELKASPDTVLHTFRKHNQPDPIIKRAWFDQLDPVADLPEQICFALLDGDFYASIKTSLSLVAPKMSTDGLIVVHDYRNPSLPGSAKAVNEFLAANSNFSLSVSSTLAILKKVD